MIGREKKCIMLTINEFEAVVESLYNEEVHVDISDDDNLCVSLTEEDLPAEDLHERLAHYFYVDGITSIHIVPGNLYEPYEVWLVCKNDALVQNLGDGISIIAEKHPDPDMKEICISLQDASTGIIFQDLAVIGPDYDPRGNAVSGQYTVRVYPDGEDESNANETCIIALTKDEYKRLSAWYPPWEEVSRFTEKIESNARNRAV